jgi:hypothetical protein
LDNRIDLDDFRKLKEEQTEILDQLNDQLNSINQKLARCDDPKAFSGRIVSLDQVYQRQGGIF